MNTGEFSSNPSQRLSGEPLSPYEVTALWTDPDKGIVPVTMQQFDSLEDFANRSNNFPMFFTLQEGHWIGDTIRDQKVFKRLCILEPQLVDDATTQLQGKEVPPSSDVESWQILYKAYRKMSELVDVNDAAVMMADGTKDTFLLCR